MTTAKRIALIAMIAVAAVVLPTAAQASTLTFNAPIQLSVKACNGDTIQLSGQLLGVLTTTIDSAGGVLFAMHSQPQGISGIDLQTGTKYLGTGLTRDLLLFGPSGTATITLIDRFHIQATTGAQSFDVSETLHLTVLANGTVTAAFDNISASC